MQRDDLLVWMDLEMTSLVDVRVDSITQIAVVLTDEELRPIAELEEITIHADQSAFDNIPPDAKAIYDQSGLIPDIVASTVTEAEAEARVMAFLTEHVAHKTSPLCGNSTYHDRLFLKFRMPTVESYLHYRTIDVSSVKELARRWRPELYSQVEKMKENKTHRALDDIKGSIAELRFYQENWLK